MKKFSRRVLTLVAVLAIVGGVPTSGHAAEIDSDTVVSASLTNRCAFLTVGRIPYGQTLGGFWHVTNHWSAPVFVVINSGGSVWGQNIYPGQVIHFEARTDVQCDAAGSIGLRPRESEVPK